MLYRLTGMIHFQEQKLVKEIIEQFYHSSFLLSIISSDYSTTIWRLIFQDYRRTF